MKYLCFCLLFSLPNLSSLLEIKWEGHHHIVLGDEKVNETEEIYFYSTSIFFKWLSNQTSF